MCQWYKDGYPRRYQDDITPNNGGGISMCLKGRRKDSEEAELQIEEEDKKLEEEDFEHIR